MKEYLITTQNTRNNKHTLRKAQIQQDDYKGVEVKTKETKGATLVFKQVRQASTSGHFP